MKNKLLILLSSFFYLTVLSANTDLSISAVGITYPSGMSSNASIGYTKLIYGSSNDLIRGYIRPYTKIKSSLFINSVALGINISPILPIEISLSKEIQKRAYEEFKAFDCTQVTCTVDKLTRNHFELNLALAYKNIFFFAKNDWQSLTLNESKFKYFGEESASILGLGTSESLFIHNSLLGYKLNNDDFISLFLLAFKLKNSGESSSIKLLTYGRTIGKWSFLAGVGGMSRYGTTHFTSVFNIKWSYLKGIFPFH